MRLHTVKLLEENIGRPLSDINHSRMFLNVPPRIMEIKTKTNKLNLLKLKRFCTAKETISKRKGQLTDWEKIFANVTDNGLVSKNLQIVHEDQHYQDKQLIQKWAGTLSRSI